MDWCLLAAVLCVTAATTLVVSHFRLLEFDEQLSLWTDTAPTARAVVWIQTHFPISLDPPVYHLLSHWSMQAFGKVPWALRLPALLSFLTLQLCLFDLVRRLAGARAGVVAALIPLLTASSTYAGDGRPYATMLGCNAAALLCWHLAKSAPIPANRTVAKLLLALALVVCVLSHFFGLLILIPIVLAELVDSIEHRRIDFGAIAALCAGLASIAVLLPFKRAVAPYTLHYYNHFLLKPPLMAASYRFMITGDPNLDSSKHLWAFMTICLVLLAVAWVSVLRRPTAAPRGLWAGVLALALLPIFGYALAVYAIHSMEIRHVLPLLVAFAIVAAVWLAPLWKARWFPALIVAGLLFASYVSYQRVLFARADANRLFATFGSDAPGRAMLANKPDAHVYIQNFGVFLFNATYPSDPALLNRLTLVYDEKREYRWDWNTTYAISSEFLPRFTPFHAVPLDQALADPNALFVLTDSPNSWLTRELDADGYQTTWLGKVFAEGVYAVAHPVSGVAK